MTRLWQGNAGPVAVVVAVIMAFLATIIATDKAFALSTFAEKSSGRFKVVALLTTDKNYWQKWDTPRRNVPRFNIPTVIAPGEKTRLIILVSNPKLSGGSMKLTCDADASWQGGRVEPDVPEMPCIGSVANPLKDHFVMMDYSMVLSARDGELPVNFKLNVKVTDKNAGRTVRLRLGVKVAEK